jgi:hypothetical protein
MDDMQERAPWVAIDGSGEKAPEPLDDDHQGSRLCRAKSFEATPGAYRELDQWGMGLTPFMVAESLPVFFGVFISVLCGLVPTPRIVCFFPLFLCRALLGKFAVALNVKTQRREFPEIL